MMKRIFQMALLTSLLSVTTAHAQNGKRPSMQALIDENMQFAAAQYKVLMKATPPNVMPRMFQNGKSITSGTEWWCSGFYPGSLWYIYEYTHDTAIKAEAERRLAIQEKEKRFTGNHDIGFMIFCSFGNAYRITGDPRYKDVIDTAARYQITRFRPSMQSFQSWNKNARFEAPVIIDNMMNLEQLCWVSENSGDQVYKDIAIRHANTTLKNHFRPDYSSYHVVDYDLKTGQVRKKVTWQGAAHESAWARGQAWGLYGYAMLYRFTKDENYLKQAKNIARFILHHPNLPADKVPYWDFNAPGIPDTYRDVSAASITASALLELAQYTKGKEKKEFLQVAETMLRSLSSEAYRAKLGENGGFLLMHSVGSMPHKSEVDVPLTYADYYFLEALLRYKNWYLNQ